MQNKPHKHAELIKALADNIDLKIQANCDVGDLGEWIDISHTQFFDMMHSPKWAFRIKPKRKPDIHLTVGLGFLVEPKLLIAEHYRFSNPYLALNNDEYFYMNGYKYEILNKIKLTIDSQNNKIKEVTWD